LGILGMALQLVVISAEEATQAVDDLQELDTHYDSAPQPNQGNDNDDETVGATWIVDLDLALTDP
jgi:hypothetical protein